MNELIIDINNWTTIKISGVQKLEYLNGIITYDLNKLKENQVVRSLFLTPKAKIRSIYWLKSLDDTYVLYCPPEYRQNLIEDLLRFKLEMDVKLEDITAETPPLFLEECEDSEIELGGIGFAFVNIEIPPTGFVPNKNFNAWLISHGELPFEYYLDQNPYEVGLNDTIALEKGCFLGQEPLSRMFYRGKPRKYLYLLEGHSSQSNESLLRGGEIVGEIITSQEQDGVFKHIAYINSNVDNLEDLGIDGSDVKVISKIGYYPKIDR